MRQGSLKNCSSMGDTKRKRETHGCCNVNTADIRPGAVMRRVVKIKNRILQITRGLNRTDINDMGEIIFRCDGIFSEMFRAARREERKRERKKRFERVYRMGEKFLCAFVPRLLRISMHFSQVSPR